MKLTGSRATQTHDEFSDWDYLIETAEDGAAVEAAVGRALCWTLTKRGSLHIVTLLDPACEMFDYTAKDSTDAALWARLEAAQTNRAFAEYWIIAFKHLKALKRGKLLLLDVGLDISTGLLRDLYVQRHFGPGAYKDFFSFKRIPEDHDFSALFAVTGMPTTTVRERVEKLRAMNASVSELFPDTSQVLNAGLQRKLVRAYPVECSPL